MVTENPRLGFFRPQGPKIDSVSLCLYFTLKKNKKTMVLFKELLNDAMSSATR